VSPEPDHRLLGPPHSTDSSRGNLVVQSRTGGKEAVLKVYRPRHGPLGEGLADFSQRCIEGKRGARPRRRRDTERESLEVWRVHGFDAPAVLAGEAPDWAKPHPVLWMEYLPGRTLFEYLEDPRASREERIMVLGSFAESCARRHRTAVATGETRLVQEHPSLRHVMVSGSRLATFDLENAYAAAFPVRIAVAFELSSTLRSMLRLGEGAFESFLAAYAAPEILRESLGVFFAPSLRWRIYRWLETSRRGASSKTAAMRRLAGWLGGGGPAL